MSLALRYALRLTANPCVRVRHISSTSSNVNSIPWFMSHDDEEFQQPAERVDFVHAKQIPPIPEDTPEHIRHLHSTLTTLPHLDTSYLMVTRPIEPIAAPPLPILPRKGRRRRRGGTDFGSGIDIPISGLWSWYILAQVKEGAEGKGSITHVIRTVRNKLQELSKTGMMVQVPLNRRHLSVDGWEMLDAGDLAIHVISREAREKWFANVYEQLEDSYL